MCLRGDHVWRNNVPSKVNALILKLSRDLLISELIFMRFTFLSMPNVGYQYTIFEKYIFHSPHDYSVCDQQVALERLLESVAPVGHYVIRSFLLKAVPSPTTQGRIVVHYCHGVLFVFLSRCFCFLPWVFVYQFGFLVFLGFCLFWL